MPEEVLFEIPEVRITTEQIVFCNATFAVCYVASTDIDERMTGWSTLLSWIVVLLFAFLHTSFLLPVCRFLGIWEIVAFAFVVVPLMMLHDRLPRAHVLRITMTDKMFYEVITRTPKEADIIQQHINEAMTRKKQTEP
jgi:hypothetical protein